ncbi:MAG: UvrABC system protein C, partial [Microgenomates group bacterium GW2011_GWA2_47_8]
MGKAIRLRSRLRSYTQLTKLSDRIYTLSTTATEVRYLELGSELEALLTEAELVSTYQPPYNVLLKDDKSPLYIHISQAAFPTITTVRKRDMLQHKLAGTLLGPYQSDYRVKEVLDIT